MSLVGDSVGAVFYGNATGKSEMGPIEAGVRESMRREKIENPSTAPELLAIELAKRLDLGVDDKSLAGISRELRLVMEEVRNQPEPSGDWLTGMQEGQ